MVARRQPYRVWFSSERQVGHLPKGVGRVRRRRTSRRRRKTFNDAHELVERLHPVFCNPERLPSWRSRLGVEVKGSEGYTALPGIEVSRDIAADVTRRKTVCVRFHRRWLVPDLRGIISAREQGSHFEGCRLLFPVGFRQRAVLYGQSERREHDVL